MDNIALVYKTGGEYTPEYVNRLAGALEPYGLVTCLTDHDGPLRCPTLPLQCGWPGWWSKMELFARFRVGRTVYFDLDTVITGDISPLFRLYGPFYMLADFYKPNRRGSGVMVWNGDHVGLFDQFRPVQHMKEYRTPAKWGDQQFIYDHLRSEPGALQNACPGLIASYKAGTAAEKLRAGVVCYHGKPRPHETGWQV